MNLEKVLENGTKVFIFHDIEKICYEDILQGIVIKSEKNEDENLINYIVLGEDGNEYYGSYGKKGLGNSIFLLGKDVIDADY